MEDIKSQLANRLKEAYNVLITVTSNPSLDQLSAAIGLTLMLNKLGKHATTVFSGEVPPMLGFLHPEKTIEKNTDSLRDFIISLDKAKADKLRYKIEDQFVKIFITPYHTSIDEKDLVFSQGDFNVDVVVAIGVHKREELDSVITAHGRILHDATVSTLNTAQPSTLGSINWSDTHSSSLCEMILYLSDLFGNAAILDAQTANALLTGIVAETQRFSNQKTTSLTMSASSRLLAAGANQQLVATQLQPPTPPPAPAAPKEQPKPPQAAQKAPVPPDKPDDRGVIRIDHTNPKAKSDQTKTTDQEPSDMVQVQIDEQGELKTLTPDQPATVESVEDKKPEITHQEPALKFQSGGNYMNTPPKDADDYLGDIDSEANEDEKSSIDAKTIPPPPLLSHDAPGDGGDNKDDKPADADKEFMAPIDSLNAQSEGRQAFNQALKLTNNLPEPNTDDTHKNVPPPPIAPPLVDQPPIDGGTDQMNAL